MLIPRFSIKLMLLLTTVAALVFLAAKYAIEGRVWALTIVISVGLTGAIFLLFATFFVIAYFLSAVGSNRPSVKLESPFADDRLPPQIVPPREVAEE